MCLLIIMRLHFSWYCKGLIQFIYKKIEEIKALFYLPCKIENYIPNKAKVLPKIYINIYIRLEINYNVCNYDYTYNCDFNTLQFLYKQKKKKKKKGKWFSILSSSSCPIIWTKTNTTRFSHPKSNLYVIIIRVHLIYWIFQSFIICT